MNMEQSAGLSLLKTFLEELVGEIEDEHDVDEDEIIENIDGSFSADPKVEIEEFTQYFSLEIDPLAHRC